MRYAWVGGRCNWISEDGCFALDFAFKADRVGNMLGACDSIWLQGKLSTTLSVGGRCSWTYEVGPFSADLFRASGSHDWVIGACIVITLWVVGHLVQSRALG